MRMPAAPTSTAVEKLDKEAITLDELKLQLGYVAPSTTAPLTPDEAAKLERCIESFLVRFLQSKHLSVSEAASKLRRRRVFESTLPAITVTPSVVACLRSGAMRIIGRDLEQRLVLYFDARQLAQWPTVNQDDAERLMVLLCLYMEHRCMQCAYAAPVAGKATAMSASSSSYRFRQQMVVLINAHGVAPTRAGGSLLRHSAALQPIVSKYFPHLIDFVLIAGAAFSTRQAIQATLAQAGTESQRAVEMLQDQDLTRYMDPTVIPASLGGKNQAADEPIGSDALATLTGIADHDENGAADGAALHTNDDGLSAGGGVSPGSTLVAEAVLRHWYLVTAFMTTESHLLQNQPGCPQRPLYLPPPLQFMPPTTSLAIMLRDGGAADGRSAAGASALRNGEVAGSYGSARPVFPYFMAVPATVPTLSGYSSPANGGGGGDDAGAGGGSSAKASKVNNSNSATNRLHTSSTRRHRVPVTSVPGASPMPKPPGGLDVEPTTIDDGLCSSLMSSTFVGDEDEDGFDDDSAHSEEGLNAAKVRTGSPAGAYGATGADVDSKEEEKIKSDPRYALQAVRQERGRRLIAEQRVQLAQLGLTMDPHNASLVERELAGIHEELNVLVSEVLVRSREAAGPHASPSLEQLLDVTVSVLEASQQVPERVPAIMAFAQPVQRDEGDVDNSVGDGCCCSVM